MHTDNLREFQVGHKEEEGGKNTHLILSIQILYSEYYTSTLYITLTELYCILHWYSTLLLITICCAYQESWHTEFSDFGLACTNFSFFQELHYEKLCMCICTV